MNTFCHFLVGYFLARKCKYKYDQFQSFFFSFAAILPDLDYIFGIEHATWTHTLVIGLAMALGFVAITEMIGYKFLKKIQFSLGTMLIYALIALLSHFFLDIFTYVHEDCATTLAHQYFWPWLDLSFHMNCLWTGVEYWHRIVIEWVFVFPPLIIWVLYNWVKKGENLFYMLSPRHWRQYIKPVTGA
jgi:membrane-bound metal-dependent hydrolase YbcI (DUF457 family)